MLTQPTGANERRLLEAAAEFANLALQAAAELVRENNRRFVRDLQKAGLLWRRPGAPEPVGQPARLNRAETGDVGIGV